MASKPAEAENPPRTVKSKILEAGAEVVQDFKPVNQICAHLNAFHVYASDPGRCVEANHYCSHLNEDLRQCLIYDSPEKGARLIGVEYMISPKLYETLPASERKLWHSHVFEVKSGMLVMPQPSSSITPSTAWNFAETSEMHDVIPLYGKTYHMWQVDRGDVVPMGHPELMLSFTDESTVTAEAKAKWEARDQRFNVNSEQKAKQREGISVPEIHPDADQAWQK